MVFLCNKYKMNYKFKMKMVFHGGALDAKASIEENQLTDIRLVECVIVVGSKSRKGLGRSWQNEMKMTLKDKDKSPIPDSPMIEVIVRLKLPLTHYEVATELSEMYKYKHFDDFVSALIKEDIERE